MKFYGALSEFFKRKTRNSSDQNDASENVRSEAVQKVAANSSVVRFEDCERINRERFAAVENSRLSSTNQYYAALSGEILSKMSLDDLLIWKNMSQRTFWHLAWEFLSAGYRLHCNCFSPMNLLWVIR